MFSPAPRRSAASLRPAAGLFALGLAASLLSAAHATAQTPLGAGDTAIGTLAAGDTALYVLEGMEDGFLFAEVRQMSVDVRVRILAPDGSSIGTIDGPRRGSERFSRQLREAGPYTLQITVVGEEGGAFAIEVHRLEPLETDPKRLTDQLMSPWTGEGTPGGAVQVWRNGRTLYSKAYGMANLTYDVPFRTDTPTNIGSTSKQFTAFAIMLQQERGALSLDDDIRVHIPELPEFDQTITIRHLLTHTSGLREFLNLLIMGGRRLDQGDWIDRSELVDVVRRQPALQNEPGAEWNYNNTAFGLAALIVERTSGQDFGVFMRSNVFEPLGMTRTIVRTSPHALVPGGSEGYTPGGTSYLQIGDLGGAVGAGGIYSTVEDLQRWAENFAAPKVGSREIFDEMMTSYVLNDGEETGYGYGLGVDEQRGLKRVNHNGADVAHRSGFVWYPEIEAGATVQSNHSDFNSGIVMQIAEAFFEDAMEPEGKADAVVGDFDPEGYDPSDFDVFAGRYSLDAQPAFILTFMRDGDTFYTQATGQQRIEISPTSDSTFALSVVEASVTFHVNADGSVEGLTLHQNGDNHATRLEDDAATEAWSPTEEDLGDYVGRFFSEELETYYTIELSEGALTVLQRRLDPFTLEPGLERDAMSGGDLLFSFERDRAGHVIGFYVANGRTRDVRFQRVR